MNKAYGFIHCHSEHSLMDSPLKLKDLCARAKEMGATAVSLTDHGTCTGLMEFVDLCNEYQIKPILGVEAYVKTDYAPRAHLVLLAKNYKGYQEISRAVTESNENQETVVNVTVPVMDKELLKKHFKKGNVIATTACISGVVASVFKYYETIEKNKEGKLKKLEKYDNPNSEKYIALKTELNQISVILSKKRSERQILENLALKNYKKRIMGLEAIKKSISTEDEHIAFEEQMRMLKKEQEESEKAKNELPVLKKEIAELTDKQTELLNKCKPLEKEHEKYKALAEEINDIDKLMITEEEIYEKAEAELLWFKELFGDDLYVELQYHGMKEEKRVMPILAELAQKNNIKLSASNDSHTTDKSQTVARQLMQSMRFKKWMEQEKSEAECYMKSDEELSDALQKILPKNIVEQAMDGVKEICDTCLVRFPKKNHYPKYRDEKGRTVSDVEAARLLRELCYKKIPVCYPDGFNDYKRLEYELTTIIDLGYAHYTLIVSDMINFAKEYVKTIDDTKTGYAVGPGRGSGAGSVVNYLSGITSLDPLKYGLIFERYLNKDRVSMPDIDTDYSNEVREATIEYAKKKYGIEAVANIRTSITQGARATVGNTARLRGYELYPITNKASEDQMQKGRKRLQYLGESIRKDIPAVPGIKLKNCIDDLYKTYYDTDSKIILERAQMIEGTITGTSVHAAGVIITDGIPVKDYVPLIYTTNAKTKKKIWATQCDMVEAEKLHLLKMDFLGLSTLDIITECMRRIKKNTGLTIDPERLEYDEAVFSELLCKGKTDCVFQVESIGMKNLLKEFKPNSIEDIILLVAAYRPGPMEFIPDIIKVKHKQKEPKYIIPQLEDILSTTYGYPIYQEQIMDIFHKCAGFTLGEADIIRRYMSKKKEEKFLEYKPKFINGLIKNGAEESDAEEFWESLVDFAKYCFNKSHAASYAILLYVTAWLKYHYPVEYMCAVINHSDTKKMPALLNVCKMLGIKIIPPDINKSYEKCEDKNGCIIYGLGNIKGIDNWAKLIVSERQENGPFLSFSDFLLRAHINKGVTEKLVQSGVFDCFYPDKRIFLENKLTQLVTHLDSIKKKEKSIAEKEAKIVDARLKKDRERIQKQIREARVVIECAHAEITNIEIPENIKEDKMQVLIKEKELLGAYISEHPLDAYASILSKKNNTRIDEFEPGKKQYTGMITNLKIVEKNGGMAFFQLEDMTGNMQVCCYKEAYEKCKEFLSENIVVQIYGKGSYCESANEEDEQEPKLIAYSITLCKTRRRPIFISSIPEKQNEIQKIIEKYKDKSGHPVILHCQISGDITEYDDVKVSSEIIRETQKDCFIKLLDFHHR